MVAGQLEPLLPLFYRVAVERGGGDSDDVYIYRVSPKMTLGHFNKYLLRCGKVIRFNFTCFFRCIRFNFICFFRCIQRQFMCSVICRSTTTVF